MIKSPILDWRYYHTTIKNSIKAKWFIILILFPVGLYVAFRLLEQQIISGIMPFLPQESDKSLGFYTDYLHLVFSEFLWLSGFFLLAWLFVVYVPVVKLISRIEIRLISASGFYAMAIIGISFITSVITAYYALEQFPNSSDEYAYLYQAETLSKGKLWERAHAHPDFFYFNHIVQKNGISVSRFPPGWPAVLSVAFYFGFPAFLVNPILSLITLILFYQFARRFYDSQTALWSLLAMAFTSYYIFNSASFFSHSSCLLMTLIFVYGIHRYGENHHIRYALLAGFSLGFMITIRYFTAVIIFIPFFLFLIHRHRFRSIIVFFLMGLGALPCLALMGWYNYSITGNPLLPVTVWAFSDEALGFVKGHSFAKGVEHVMRWAGMFIYWCSPGLLILYAVFLWRKIKDKAERIIYPEDYIFILLIIGYFFYYEVGGNQYGPRFFFEAFPFLVLMVVKRVFQSREKWTLAIFLAGLIYAIVKIPFIADREHRVIEERNDLYRTVEESKIRNAVVFISSHTGIIRPMPAGDLTRNDVNYQNDVIYAMDLKEKDSTLMRHYPDRTFYRYVKDREEVVGKLIRLQ